MSPPKPSSLFSTQNIIIIPLRDVWNGLQPEYAKQQTMRQRGNGHRWTHEYQSVRRQQQQYQHQHKHGAPLQRTHARLPSLVTPPLWVSYLGGAGKAGPRCLASDVERLGGVEQEHKRRDELLPPILEQQRQNVCRRGQGAQSASLLERLHLAHVLKTDKGEERGQVGGGGVG